MSLFEQIFEDFNMTTDWLLTITDSANLNDYEERKYWFEDSMIRLFTYADYNNKTLHIAI